MSQQISLYNPALAPKVDLFSGSSMLIGLGVVLAIVLLVAGITGVQAHRVAAQERSQSARLAGLQAEVARLAQQVAARKPDAALQQEFAGLEALLTARNEVMGLLGGGALGDTRGVSEYFRAFGRQRIEGVWLTGFSIGGAGSEIVIQGRTTDPNLLPGYLARLRREGALRGRAFESLAVTQPAPVLLDGKPVADPGYLEFRMATQSPEPAERGSVR